jgi:hypothetical protein
MSTEKGISQREYGRLIGVSGEAVRKAIKAGYIVKGWDEKAQRIYPNKANEEWGKAFKEDVTVQDFKTPQNTNPNSITITSNDTLYEAKRKKEILSAKIMALDLAERQGVLVLKEAIYKELFAKGQEIRSDLLNMPNRCIDNIIAANDRNKAMLILTDEIVQTLEKFTKTI